MISASGDTSRRCSVVKKIRPSEWVVCDNYRNCARLHLAFCQNRCSDYPCGPTQEAEMALMMAGLPYQFNKKGEAVNGITSEEAGAELCGRC